MTATNNDNDGEHVANSSSNTCGNVISSKSLLLKDAVDQLDSADDDAAAEVAAATTAATIIDDDDFATFQQISNSADDNGDELHSPDSNDKVAAAAADVPLEASPTSATTTATTTAAPLNKEPTTAAGDVVSKEDQQQQKQRFVSPNDFELLKVIGMGAFGKVLQVRNKQSGTVLAMKIISKRILKRKASYVENIKAERDILTRVKSPFVVTMHCSFQTHQKLFIIMDFLAGGELFLRLGKEGIFLERSAAFYLGEIILALDHLHGLGILQ
jgi:Protein kinase domain